MTKRKQGATRARGAQRVESRTPDKASTQASSPWSEPAEAFDEATASQPDAAEGEIGGPRTYGEFFSLNRERLLAQLDPLEAVTRPQRVLVLAQVAVKFTRAFVGAVRGDRGEATPGMFAIQAAQSAVLHDWIRRRSEPTGILFKDFAGWPCTPGVSFGGVFAQDDEWGPSGAAVAVRLSSILNGLVRRALTDSVPSSVPLFGIRVAPTPDEHLLAWRKGTVDLFGDPRLLASRLPEAEALSAQSGRLLGFVVEESRRAAAGEARPQVVAAGGWEADHRNAAWIARATSRRGAREISAGMLREAARRGAFAAPGDRKPTPAGSDRWLYRLGAVAARYPEARDAIRTAHAKEVGTGDLRRP